MNLDIKTDFNDGNSIRPDAEMDRYIDRSYLSMLETSSLTTETAQMSQYSLSDPHVNHSPVHPSSPVLTVRHLRSALKSGVKYLVNSDNETVASPLSSLKPYNLLQQGILTITSSVSSLKSSSMLSKMSVLVLLLSLVAESSSVGLCRGVLCANGGTLMVDNSVWGHCRCRCMTGFVGPYCQYQLTGRRSVVSSTAVINPRRRVPRSKRLQQIKQQLSDLTPKVISSPSTEIDPVDSAMSFIRAIDDSSVISKILEAQNAVDDSYRYDPTSDGLWLLKSIRR